MKKYLIFVDSSEGELDWIAPFVRYESKKGAKFYFYLDKVGKDYVEKCTILARHGFDSSQLINRDFLFNKFDEFFYKALNKLSYTISGKRKRCDVFHFALKPYFFSKKYINRRRESSFDSIFRDYNLKPSLALNYYLSINKKAHVIVYPHAIGVQPNNANRVPPIKVKCDLWLENTKLSNYAVDVYKKEFFVSGPPILSEARKKLLFDSESNNVLVVTRNCREKYGFSVDDALISFKGLLSELSYLGFKILIKHHPRDDELERWREIQNQYENIEEFKGSLSDLNTPLRVCLTLFGSAGIYMLAKGVPIIDFSPYKNLSEYNLVLPLHFASKDIDVVTYELPLLGIYKQEQNQEEVFNIISDSSKLTVMSNEQQEVLYRYFPSGANEAISSKLKEIHNR